uniref:Uncharacterized protein n=1 Tax=Glycine max TaxID=3847 RepID=K7M544_SOYBN
MYGINSNRNILFLFYYIKKDLITILQEQDELIKLIEHGYNNQRFGAKEAAAVLTRSDSTAIRMGKNKKMRRELHILYVTFFISTIAV